jgi:hypothetical protein
VCKGRGIFAAPDTNRELSPIADHLPDPAVITSP